MIREVIKKFNLLVFFVLIFEFKKQNHFESHGRNKNHQNRIGNCERSNIRLKLFVIQEL